MWVNFILYMLTKKNLVGAIALRAFKVHPPVTLRNEQVKNTSIPHKASVSLKHLSVSAVHFHFFQLELHNPTLLITSLNAILHT